MIKNLVSQLKKASEEKSLDKKMSIMENYQEKLQELLLSSEKLKNLDKKEIKVLFDSHNKIVEELNKLFLSYKEDLKEFQKKSKGIKAYMGVRPKRISIVSTKKG